MAVREFDGSDDTVVHAAGGLSGMTFGTFAAISKTDTVTGGHTMIAGHNSSNTFLFTGLALDNNEFNGCASGSCRFGTVSTGVWYLVVVRKATGTATPRFSVFNFTSDTWSHGDGSNTEANWTSPGASGFIRNDVQETLDLWDGRMAVRAAWSNEVHWAANSTGDSQIEAAGLHTSLQNWVDESPTALWAYNQDPLSAIDDLVGTSDQSSVVGTTVVTGDDPDGFSFDLGGGGPELMPRAVIVAG